MNIFSPYSDRPLVEKRLSPIEFNTTEELLQLDILQQYTKLEGFSHFALSVHCLYSVRNDGFDWKLIGSIKHPEMVELPQFEGWKYKALLNGKKVVLSTEIAYIIGNKITLHNGEIATKLET